MKKTLLINLSTIFVLLLSACGGVAGAAGGSNAVQAPASTNAGTSPAITSKVLKTDYTNALPIASQLAVGTLKLDKSSTPIDKAEAEQLLPLWKALRTLLTSNNAAAEEVNATVNQIESTMKPEQVQAIAEMKLTSADMGQVFSGLGFGAGGPNGGTLTPEQQATRQAYRAQNGFQGGGSGGGNGQRAGGGGNGQRPAGGGGGGGGGENFGGGGGNFGGGGGPGGGNGQRPQGTPGARGFSRSQFGVNAGLVGAVITFLSAK